MSIQVDHADIRNELFELGIGRDSFVGIDDRGHQIIFTIIQSVKKSVAVFYFPDL